MEPATLAEPERTLVIFAPPRGKAQVYRAGTISLILSDRRLLIAGLTEDEGELRWFSERYRTVGNAVRTACLLAVEFNMPLVLACDSTEQAKHYASKAGELLPRFRRVALERILHTTSDINDDIDAGYIQ